jgi:hypothetical protein
MASGIFDTPIVGIVNRLFVGSSTRPWWAVGTTRPDQHSLCRTAFGQDDRDPVGYRRSGDAIVIKVSSPDNKTWWRNFLGEGGPITLLKLDGQDRTGHAVAKRDGQGRVTVTVRLD